MPKPSFKPVLTLAILLAIATLPPAQAAFARTSATLHQTAAADPARRSSAGWLWLLVPAGGLSIAFWKIRTEASSVARKVEATSGLAPNLELAEPSLPSVPLADSCGTARRLPDAATAGVSQPRRSLSSAPSAPVAAEPAGQGWGAAAPQLATNVIHLRQAAHRPARKRRPAGRLSAVRQLGSPRVVELRRSAKSPARSAGRPAVTPPRRPHQPGTMANRAHHQPGNRANGKSANKIVPIQRGNQIRQSQLPQSERPEP
ncbi:MAG: hypothetical protein F6J97_01795 [Leptolyngbya sp. SIO4C1]|nr:hypothetical protein [Leptolyngbya sp. SIO4C1]